MSRKTRLGMPGWLLGMVLLLGGNAIAAEATGPVVKDITVAGNMTVDAEKVKYHMSTRVGHPLDKQVLEEDFKRIWKMGSFADVQIYQEKIEGGIRVKVVVREKPVIRRLIFRGNKEIRTEKLEKEITSKVGQNYDPGVVNNDIRTLTDLYREQYHFFAEITHSTEPFEDGIRLVYNVDEGRRVTVNKILFEGNSVLPNKLLLKHMATKANSLFTSGKFDEQQYAQDIERLRLLYQSKGYLDVQIDGGKPEVDDGKSLVGKPRKQITLTIKITEGEIYKIGRISFDGNTVRTDEEIRGCLKVMPGDVYNPLVIADDAKRIQTLYGSTGRVFTKVSPDRVLSEEGNILDLVMHIKEGEEVLVDSVMVTGLTYTQERVALRDIELFPGEVYDSRKVDQTRQNLNRLNIFQRPVSVEIKESDEKDRAKLLVDLEEQRTGSISFGVGYSSADGPVGSMNLSERNFDHSKFPHSWKELISGSAFKGAGERFSLSLAVGSETEKASLDFTNPWIFDRPIRFGTGAFYNNREYDEYDELRTGAYLLLGRRLFDDRNWDLSAKYKIERVDISDVESDASPELHQEEGDNLISRAVFRLAFDNRDDIFDPTKGVYAHFTQEIAGGLMGGDKDFWRTQVEYNYFKTFFRDRLERPHVLAFRAEMDMAEAYGDSSEVPMYERYYAGGIGSLRGWDYRDVAPRSMIGGDQIGGELLYSTSVEYFFPIWGDALRGSLYFDAAKVERYLNDRTWWNDDDEEWRMSVGAGVHMRTPLGPIPVRIYFNNPLNDKRGDDTQSVQFTFGAFF